MSALRVELPDKLRVEVADRLAQRGISESAWVEEAVREKLAADAELEALTLRAACGNQAAFERILARVPDAKPEPGDER